MAGKSRNTDSGAKVQNLEVLEVCFQKWNGLSFPGRFPNDGWSQCNKVNKLAHKSSRTDVKNQNWLWLDEALAGVQWLLSTD